MEFQEGRTDACQSSNASALPDAPATSGCGTRREAQRRVPNNSALPLSDKFRRSPCSTAGRYQLLFPPPCCTPASGRTSTPPHPPQRWPRLLTARTAHPTCRTSPAERGRAAALSGLTPLPSGRRSPQAAALTAPPRAALARPNGGQAPLTASPQPWAPTVELEPRHGPPRLQPGGGAGEAAPQGLAPGSPPAGGAQQPQQPPPHPPAPPAAPAANRPPPQQRLAWSRDSPPPRVTIGRGTGEREGRGGMESQWEPRARERAHPGGRGRGSRPLPLPPCPRLPSDDVSVAGFGRKLRHSVVKGGRRW